MSDQSVHPAFKPGQEDVKFVLDGREVVGKKGETIITVAARENTYIPHYCWHPSLSVAGNCRLCLVEVHMPGRDGKLAPMPKPAIACQTPIAAGMHVFTESKLAKECQDGMMEFLLANHPLDCPICDRGGECQLQRYSMEYGKSHARMADKKRKFVKPQADPLIDIERNRCIMCTRCVRFSDEVGGEHTMGVFDRGEGNYIGTFGQGPVGNILSGNVIDICPVGCLTSKPFRFKARVWELLQTQSTSIWDASGAKCTHWTRNGKLYRTTPPSRKDHDRYTVNEDTEEFIDNLTRFGSDYSQHEARWDESRIRIGASLLPAAFTEAVRQAAAGLAKVKVNHGADSIAVLVSPRATMEEGYLAGKFARTVIGTANVDWRMSFQTAAAAEAATVAFDHADGDLENNFDAVVVLNGDYLHQVPTFAMRVKEHARLNKKPLIMIGHHHDFYLAKHATHAIHCAPGATAKVLALLGEAVKGTDQTKALGDLIGAENVVPLLMALKGNYGKALIVQSLESMNGAHSAQDVPAALALKESLGANWKYIPVLRDRNAFGLYAVGAQPGRLPGESEAVRKAWSLDGRKPVATNDSFSARRIVDLIESGQIKGLVALGADVLYQYHDHDRLLKALGKLEFFIVSDLFKSPITTLANVFIAATGNLEKDGTYCDLEGNLARLCETEGIVGGARPDWETMTGLANLMGAENFNYESVEDVFNEMMSVIAPGFQGSFDGLRLAGPRNDISVRDPGGARQHTPQYNPGDYRTDGAHFRWTGTPVTAASSAIEVPKVSAGEGELLVTWGGHCQDDDYHLNHASIADLLKSKPYAEINPHDARALGFDDRHRAILHRGGESVEVELVVREGPARGTIYMPAGIVGLDVTGVETTFATRIELVDSAVEAVAH